MSEFLIAIPAFIASIPKLIELMSTIMALVQRFVAWADTKKVDEWLNKIEANMDQLEQAKTPQEMRDAAKSLADLIGTIK
jgi:hypothetical protein